MTRPWGIGLADYRPRRKRIEIACKMRRLAKMEEDPEDPLHGTATGYNYGCRCGRCTRAKSKSMNEYRFKRRLQKMVVGYLVVDVSGEPIMVCVREADAKRALEMIHAASSYNEVMMMTGGVIGNESA